MFSNYEEFHRRALESAMIAARQPPLPRPWWSVAPEPLTPPPASSEQRDLLIAYNRIDALETLVAELRRQIEDLESTIQTMVKDPADDLPWEYTH